MAAFGFAADIPSAIPMLLRFVLPVCGRLDRELMREPVERATSDRLLGRLELATDAVPGGRNESLPPVPGRLPRPDGRGPD